MSLLWQQRGELGDFGGKKEVEAGRFPKPAALALAHEGVTLWSCHK